MRGPRTLLPLLSVLLAAALPACQGEGPTALSVRIVDGAGGNPVSSITSGRIEIVVSQEGGTEDIVSEPIRGGTFDVSAPIATYGAVTTLEVTIEDDATGDVVLVGATPPFVPSELGAVWVVVGTPDRCTPIGTPHLPTPVASAGLVLQRGVNLLSFGGRDDSDTPNGRVTAFVPQLLTSLSTSPAEIATVSPTIGAAHAALLGTGATHSLILVASEAGVFTFDAAFRVDGARDRAISAHAGAGAESSVLELGDLGAVIVGGSFGGAPVNGLTYVSTSGVATTTSTLAVARARPAVARIGGGILVAGGGAAGTPLFEIIPTTPGTALPIAGDFPQREGAILAVDGTSSAAVLAWGRAPLDAPDMPGALVPGSLVITRCTTTAGCTVSAGPDPGTLRSGAVAVARPALGATRRPVSTLVVGGEIDDAGTTAPSRLATSITWSGTTPTFTEAGLLTTARTDHAAVELGGGGVLVVGGNGEGRRLSEIELCF